VNITPATVAICEKPDEGRRQQFGDFKSKLVKTAGFTQYTAPHRWRATRAAPGLATPRCAGPRHAVPGIYRSIARADATTTTAVVGNLSLHERFQRPVANIDSSCTSGSFAHITA